MHLIVDDAGKNITPCNINFCVGVYVQHRFDAGDATVLNQNITLFYSAIVYEPGIPQKDGLHKIGMKFAL
jgi:hypothetical protein